MLLYYITDRFSLGSDETQRRQRLLQKISEAARLGVDFIQLREKDLSGKQLDSLATDAMRAIQENSPGNPARTKLLINSRADVALACSADGVHLRSGDISPRNVRGIYSATAYFCPAPVISVACHARDEVACAARDGADFAIFAPIFEKQNRGNQNFPSASAGLKALEQACREDVPVIALGGITLENARDCMHAGAAGIAAIRLFQANDVGEVVGRLRGFNLQL